MGSNGDPKTEKGPQMGTHLGAVHMTTNTKTKTNFGKRGVQGYQISDTEQSTSCECGIKPNNTDNPDEIIGGTEVTVSF